MRKKFSILALIALSFAVQSNLHPQTVTFIAIGDWGREGKYLQKETADAMGVYADQYRCDFVLTLGDNIYDTGVMGTDDPKWQTSFEQIYRAPSLQIPWYAALGNHDYAGNVEAQIDYSNVSTRWKMPARYYSFEKPLDDSTFVLFVVLDTNPFIESYRKYFESDPSGNFGREIISEDPDVQLKWIDSVLEYSNAKWKIVAGHHPIYTGGQHGNTKELIDKLDPVLEKYNVDMYMAGHDHDMQHLRKRDGIVDYFVSGAGSALRETSRMEYTLFAQSINGFLAVKVQNAVIEADFIDYRGSVLYSTVITK
jgi:acid phosphatase